MTTSGVDAVLVAFAIGMVDVTFGFTGVSYVMEKLV
jgi:hypothetical protein